MFDTLAGAPIQFVFLLSARNVVLHTTARMTLLRLGYMRFLSMSISVSVTRVVRSVTLSVN